MKMIQDWPCADWYRQIILLAGCTVLVLAVYSTTISSFFVMGEMRTINWCTPETWKEVLQLFTRQGWGSLYYRPIVRLTLWMNYSLFDLNPIGYHIFNLSFHMFNTILVFYLGTILTKDKNASGIAALFFAIHPIHTDAVTRVLNNNSITSTFFYLLAVISFIKYISFNERRRAYLVITVFTFIFSLLARETAITLPVVLFLYEFIFYIRKKHGYKHIFNKKAGYELIFPYLKKYIPFFLILFFYFILRLTFFGTALPARAIGLETPLRVSYHLLQLFAPINVHTFNFEDWSQLALNIIILFNFLSIIILLVLDRKFKISKDIINYCSLWVIITCFPLYLMALHLYSPVRLLYISSVGSSILLGLFIMKGYHNLRNYNAKWAKIVLIFLIFSLISSWSIRAIQRNQIYKQVGDIAQDIVLQFKNMYPEFPKGSILYLINFPNYFLSDGENILIAISDYRGALQLLYHDKSLIIYKDWKYLNKTDVRSISSYRSALQTDRSSIAYKEKMKFTKYDENLKFLQRNSFFENTKKKKCFVFEYENGVVVETISLYMKEIGPGTEGRVFNPFSNEFSG